MGVGWEGPKGDKGTKGERGPVGEDAHLPNEGGLTNLVGPNGEPGQKGDRVSIFKLHGTF